MEKLVRVSWIDQMRGLAMMCVYFAHVGISTNYYGLFTYWFIPIFFFLSGYLHNDEITKNKFKIRIINRILIPYILFTTLTILSQIPNNINLNYFLDSFINLLKGRGNWFFACITIVEILAYYISKLILINPKWKREIILFVMAIGFIAMNIVKPRSEIWWYADTAICTMAYYYSGYLFRHSSLNLHKNNLSYIILPFLIMLSMLIYTNKMLDFNVSINIFGEPWLNLPLSISGCIFTALFLQKVNIGRFFHILVKIQYGYLVSIFICFP